MALEYKQHILRSMPDDQNYPNFEPLMVLYLTDKTKAAEITKAHAAGIVGVKFYPAGATTNSDFGVTDIQNCYGALRELDRLNMMLCIHSEVTHADIFEREPIFIEEIMKPLADDFPNLKMTMEHISTMDAVDYVLSASDNIKASITCHHLLFNRNDMLVGGIKPHLYCLPILKSESHRQALVKAAISGSPKFFLGTDSAPHSRDAKESCCGCAGVFTAHALLELYTETFDKHGQLSKLEDFCSSFGADHYGLPRNTATLTLEKTSWKVPMSYDFGDDLYLRGLRAGEEIKWKLVEEESVNGKKPKLDQQSV